MDMILTGADITIMEVMLVMGDMETTAITKEDQEVWFYIVFATDRKMGQPYMQYP